MELSPQIEWRISPFLRFDSCVAPQFIFPCVFLSLPKWFPSGIFAAPQLELHPRCCVRSSRLCCFQMDFREQEQIPLISEGDGGEQALGRGDFNAHITEISLAPSARLQNYKFWVRKQQNSQTPLKVRGRESSWRWFLWFIPAWDGSALLHPCVKNRWKRICFLILCFMAATNRQEPIPGSAGWVWVAPAIPQVGSTRKDPTDRIPVGQE